MLEKPGTLTTGTTVLQGPIRLLTQEQHIGWAREAILLTTGTTVLEVPKKLLTTGATVLEVPGRLFTT